MRKETRGRKLKSEKDAEELAGRQATADEFAGAIDALLKWPFDVMADKKGEHWRLSADEKAQLSSASAKLTLKYAAWLQDWGEELVFGIVVLAIVGPRYTKDVELEKRRKESEAARTRAPGDSGERKKPSIEGALQDGEAAGGS